MAGLGRYAVDEAYHHVFVTVHFDESAACWIRRKVATWLILFAGVIAPFKVDVSHD